MENLMTLLAGGGGLRMNYSMYSSIAPPVACLFLVACVGVCIEPPLESMGEILSETPFLAKINKYRR